MARTLWLLLQIAIVVGVAVWLAENPGTVTIRWLDRVIETSVGFTVFALAALVAAAIVIYRFGRAVRNLPAETAAWYRNRQFQRGFRALNRGFAALAAGDVAEAERLAGRAEKLLKDPTITYVLSAQTAQAAGKDDTARSYFERLLNADDTAILGVRGLLKQALARGDDEKALALARQAKALRPRAPWALRTLLDLEVRFRKWADAQTTLDQAIKYGAFTQEEAQEKKVALLLARSIAAEDGEQALDTATKHARKALDIKPDFPPAAIRLAKLYAAQNRNRQARKVLLKAWDQNPHPQVAELFATVDSSDPNKVFRRSEELVDRRPDSDVGRLAMGEAALHAGHYAEARTLLRRVAESNPTRKVYQLLSDLEIAESGDTAASRHWLAEAARAAPDPAWVCRRTGLVMDEWVPVTPQGHLGTLVWTATSEARLTTPDSTPQIRGEGAQYLVRGPLDGDDSDESGSGRAAS